MEQFDTTSRKCSYLQSLFNYKFCNHWSNPLKNCLVFLQFQAHFSCGWRPHLFVPKIYPFFFCLSLKSKNGLKEMCANEPALLEIFTSLNRRADFTGTIQGFPKIISQISWRRQWFNGTWWDSRTRWIQHLFPWGGRAAMSCNWALPSWLRLLTIFSLKTPDRHVSLLYIMQGWA